MTTEQRFAEFDTKVDARTATGHLPHQAEKMLRARYLVSQLFGEAPKNTASLNQLRWMWAHKERLATAFAPVGGSFTPTPPSGTPAVPEPKPAPEPKPEPKRHPGRPASSLVLKTKKTKKTKTATKKR